MDELSSDLSLRQLEYVVAVVDLGSVSGAAQLLHVTQPTISHQLALVERRVGLPLFERAGRGVRPTAAGRELAKTGREVLEAGRRGLDRVRRAGAVDDTIVLGVLASLASTMLPPAVASWRSQVPDGELRLREFIRRDELLAALNRGEVEVGVGAPPDGWTADVQRIGWERYVLVLPPGTPGLGRRTPVRLASLKDRRWVLYDTDHGLHGLVQGVCAEAGFSPRPAVRTLQIVTAVRLAAAGLGPALVPEISVPAELRHLIALPRPALRRPVVAFGPGLSRPAIQAFLAHLTPPRTGLAA